MATPTSQALVIRDRRSPIVLGTAHVDGESAEWAPWSVPVTGLDGDGALASIELAVLRAGPGTHVLLGGASVVAAGAPPAATTPAVRNLVLVVLGSTAAKALAPWGGPHAVPALSRVASEGTMFAANRASSSLANAVVASMLTGLPSRSHGLEDPGARLPDGVVTVEEACRQGGVATAMFTANPTTGAAFGFDRSWDTFVSHDPLDDGPATQVFDEAAAWIEARKGDRFFVVVHARGGHPPWDAAPDDLKAMPPEGYLGMIEPRRAAEALAKARKHPGRFKDDDRVRAWALYDHAVDAHDEALGRLLAALRSAGRDDDTAVVVTGDVAASEAPSVPFDDSEALDEPLLATPLAIRWPPASALGGRRVDAPSTPVDLARTMLDSLGLRPPAAFQGVDLASLAQGSAAVVRATAGRDARGSLLGALGPVRSDGPARTRDARVRPVARPDVHRRRARHVAARSRADPALRGRHPGAPAARLARARPRRPRRPHHGRPCAMGAPRRRPGRPPEGRLSRSATPDRLGVCFTPGPGIADASREIARKE